MRHFQLQMCNKPTFFGRKNIYELGNVSVHVYAEYENRNIDVERLEKSWNQLIKRPRCSKNYISRSRNSAYLKRGGLL